MSDTSSKILTIKITLRESQPKIWRRFQIADDMTLGKLHDVIQIVMGWQDCHLHEFEQGKKTYRKPYPDEDDYGTPSINEDQVSVGELLRRKKQKLIYNYDMGDYWEHALQVENISEPESKQFYPNCIEGALACPPEDCGGTWGYQNMLAALADPNHEEHETFVEWRGPDFDAEEFNLKGINEVLKDFDNYKSGWDDFDGEY